MQPQFSTLNAVCAQCGKPFHANAYNLRQGWAKFCSWQCRYPTSPESVHAAFWSKVDTSGGSDSCWPWLRQLSVSGYGQVHFRGKKWRANRVAWELTSGPIPDGMRVCHNCDVRYPAGDILYRRCVNPAHLFLGTDGDNIRDAARKGRMATGDRSGARQHPEVRVTGDAHWTRLHPEWVARGDRNGARLHPERLARGDNSPSRLHPERVLRGEQNASSKLTEAQVIEVRRVYAAGGLTLVQVAAQFGIGKSQVSNIVRGLSWSHIPRAVFDGYQ